MQIFLDGGGICVSLGLKSGTTLPERLKKKYLTFKTIYTCSYTFFNLESKTKIEFWTKLFWNCGLRFVKNSIKGASKALKKRLENKYQKHEIVCNLWGIPRPKQFILSNILGHFLTGTFSLAVILFWSEDPLRGGKMCFPYRKWLFKLLENS